MMNELSLLDSLFNGLNGAYCGNYRTSYVPNVDIKEEKNAYNLEMDLPGRAENDIDVQVDKNVLTISSKKEEKVEEKSEDAKKDAESDKKEQENAKKSEEPKWLLRERTVSEFSRSFSLPEDADSENISASFKNGVLNVSIPRKAPKEAKRIAIKAA